MLVCQGRAVADGRYAAGRFSDPIARQLLEPAELEVVERVRAGQVPSDAAGRLGYELVRRTAITMAPRTIAIDEVVRAAPAQVVIVGAGLDGRAWRMPELAGGAVYEVDHPASQADKRRRLAGLTPTAGRVAFVAVDLAREHLRPALENAGFDRQAATTWVWEGVVPYLTADEVRATVVELADLSAPGSQLVVNYQAKSLVTSVMRRVMRLVLRVSRQADPMAGEPWRSKWTPEQMRNLLGAHGFAVTTDDDLFTLGAGLDLPENAGSLRNGRVAVAARA